MTRDAFVFLTVLTITGIASPAAAQPMTRSKKLIEFGWDEPDPAFMRKHVVEMEKTPFDGTVFHLSSDFLWQGWGKRAFMEAEIAQAVEDLKRTRFKKFTRNFLRFNVTPADIDWFDDFNAILGNARMAAKAARTGRAAGILFDIEQYNGQLFNYAKQRDAKTKSWSVYSAKVRERGREVMAAFQQEFPDLVVFLTWSYSLPFRQTNGDERRLPHAEYGLLKPFLDGMFEAAAGKTRIIDGFESSYGWKSMAPFDEVQVKIKQAVLPWMPDKDRYLRHASLGFGLWMDNDWRKKGWDEKDVSKNHFTPQEFEASLIRALEASDEYVWIYTEKPRWWTAPDGKPTALPTEYDRAVRNALATRR